RTIGSPRRRFRPAIVAGMAVLYGFRPDVRCGTLKMRVPSEDSRVVAMPIIILLLLAVLVATFGFWDTVQGILGAIGVVILVALLIAGVLAALGAMWWRR